MEDKELDIIFEEFFKKEENRGVRFQEYIDRGFNGEAWTDCVPDRSSILRFALWYASNAEPELKRLSEENAKLREVNSVNLNKLSIVKDNCSWITNMVAKL